MRWCPYPNTTPSAVQMISGAYQCSQRSVSNGAAMQRGLKVDTTTRCRSLKLHKRVTVAMPDILDIPPSGSVDRVPKVAFRIWRTRRGGSEAAVRRIECDREWPAAARDNSSGVEIDSSSRGVAGRLWRSIHPSSRIWRRKNCMSMGRARASDSVDDDVESRRRL